MSFAADVPDDARSERRVVLWAFAIVTTVVLLVGGIGDLLAPDEASRVDLTRTCLFEEQLAAVFDPRAGSPAYAAEDGALRALVEGNTVTIALVRTAAEGERLEQAFARLRPSAYVERRALNVYRWDRPPSPTQLQKVYDCSY